MTSILLFAAAAQAGPNELQVDVGATWLSRTDLLVSPRNFNGVLPRLELGYDRRTEGWAHTAELALSTGSFRDQPDFDYTWDGEPRMTQASAVTIVDVRYGFGVPLDVGRGTLVLGGTSANHIEDFVYVAGWLGVSTYMGAFELGPWVEWTVPVGERQTLSLEGWVPAAAWIGRNPYSVHSGEHIWKTRDNNVPKTVARHIADGSLHSLGSYQAAHLRGAWELELREHWALELSLRADVLHYTLPRPVVETQLGGGLAVNWSF